MNNPKITSVGIAAALLLFSALLFGERAEAAYYGGAEMLSLCESTDVGERNECGDWLMGVADTLEVMKYWGQYEDICIPRGAMTSQLRKVVIQELNKEPESLHLGAGGLVVNALAEAFPCD